jgi:uncharacterized protein YunC (DUF1805 family)
MMEKGKKIVREEEWGKVVIMDSAAQMSSDEIGQVVVAGSHGSENSARHVARYLPFGVILNDAGKGKNNAGISGLSILNSMHILGATVDCMTARIGEGHDNYNSGFISAVNDKAKTAGVQVGMTAIEAARIMLAAKKSSLITNLTPVVYEDEHSRIVLADTVSYLNTSHHGCVVVSGSHCARTTFEWIKDLGLKGIFLNDAGKGKNNQGISGLPLFDQAGIPAAAIDCMRAMIGNARDAWEAGIVSVANELATKLGVNEGMTVQESAKRVLKV